MRHGPRPFERLRRIGIGNALELLRIGKLGKTRELAAPPLAHGPRQLRIVTGENQERRRTGLILAHEYQWDLRTQQLQSDGRLERLGARQRGETLAEGAITDLVVIL